jgi:predicted nucleic acid-binding Zn finger protein
MSDNHRERRILVQALNEIRSQHEISRLSWLRLRSVFKDRFTRSWRMVIRNSTKKYIFKPSGKELWIAVGNNAEYLIYPLADYCSCNDFYFRVLDKEVALCYHLLAQKLAEALDHYDTIIEDDEAYIPLMKIWKDYTVQSRVKPK